MAETETTVAEATTTPTTTETVDGSQLAALRQQLGEATKRAEAAEARAELAETNKQAANREAAARRVTNKQVMEVLGAIVGAPENASPEEVVGRLQSMQNENREMWLGQIVRDIADTHGAPYELVLPYVKANLDTDSLDFSNRQIAEQTLDATVTQFAEKFPGVVAKQEQPPKPDPWGTPDTGEPGAPAGDIETVLSNAMKAGPEAFEQAWEKYGGDELMNSGAFAT